MSKNPFAPQNQGEMKLKRNAYDLSRQSLFTTDFGRLSPAFIQEVIPGDSFEISSSLAIQGMPTVFPLQTRCRVSVEYYYGRNRCVMDNFEDFIFKTKDIEHPWLRMNAERAKKMISTGSLGDLFGLPSTYANESDVISTVPFVASSYYRYSFRNKLREGSFSLSKINEEIFAVLDGTTKILRMNDNIAQFRGYMVGPFYTHISNQIRLNPFNTTFSSVISEDVFDDTFVFIALPYDNGYVCGSFAFALSGTIDVSDSKGYITFNIDDEIVSNFNNYVDENKSPVLFFGCYKDESVGIGDQTILVDNPPLFPTSATSSSLIPVNGTDVVIVRSGILDSTDSSIISANPFVGNSPYIKVNALPFRHYEMICNYYARNDKNNPYMLNGEPQYNEFIPTHAAGADDNLYDFHYRNWELDRFTSAVQSPQFGEAPLVGLTFTGSDTATLTFTDSDSNTYTAEVGVDDNDVVTTIQNFSQDIPSANLRKLQEMIHYGISINDLRVTNSFQRFLENVLRRGLRYRNQLKSHFGVGVDYPDIDIPQYIGGYSGELVVSKVTSTAQTSEANLGDFNGQLSGMIQSNHKIHCYCPEHGFIIGIVSITPIPVYTQVADKSMIKNEPFDYFLPEFGKIGFVPVHYSEVMPLQTPADGSVNDVFGYQKAWYDYMQSLDSAHGFFRTNLKDFVLQRVFAERPDLVEDFTVINPEHLTDVFVSGNIADKYNMSDKFLCNFYNHVVAKRPIPRIGTPSLE